jgi:translocation and assembly module TamA
VTPELRPLLLGASRAAAQASEPPSSELAVRRRALDDVPRLEAALRSAGHYEGTVAAELRPAPPGGGGLPGPAAALVGPAPAVIVAFAVAPGPLYRLDRLSTELEGEPGGFAPPPPAELGLRPGEPARAQAVLDAEQALLKAARARGYALAALGRRSTVIDAERKTMDVVLRLAPGPRARFGEVAFRGNEGVDAGFLRNRLPFRDGDVYDPEKVEEGRRDLLDTNLFSTVVLEEAKALTPDGRLPIAVEVAPRAARSVGASLGYQTDSGPSATAFWEHRNLLGAGESLRAETELQRVLQRLRAAFRKPDFLAREQSLIADAEARAEQAEGYDSRSLSAAVGLERTLRPGLVGSLGVAYRYVLLQEEDEPEEVFGLVSLPGRLDWDFSDDILNPTRGGRLSLNAAPFLDTLGPGRNFFRSRLTASRYLRLLEEPGLVLALRGSVGSTLGASREEIPADERFYAGGGGSVRGIPYQLAGPLDDDDKPLGGRSLLEVGAELRYRITESFGAVLFLDGGTVAASAYPDLAEEELRWGAGPGLRYFTPIGPLRLDVGVPLNRRDADDLFQLYLSIGQAF